MSCEKEITIASPSPHGEPSSRQWAEPGVGAPWKHRVFFTLIRIGGRQLAYGLMYLTVFWYLALSPGVRRRTRHYLDRRFPDRRRFWQRFADSYRVLRDFGKSLIDQAIMSILGPGYITAEFASFDALSELIGEGRGLVLVGAHVGSWQVAMSILDRLRVPVRVVMIPEGTARPDLEAQAPDAPFSIIDPRRGLDSVMEMIKALQHKEVVGLMGDRVYGSGAGAVAANLLGAAVEIPLAPYRLASATGAPIAVILTHKTGVSSYRIELAGVIRVDPKLGREPAEYEPWAREFTAALEDFAANHPYQFFNFYDLWTPEKNRHDIE